MSQPPNPVNIVTLKTLAGLAALAGPACGLAAEARAGSLLTPGPLRTAAAVVLGGLVASGVVRLLVKLSSRRSESNLLDPASELTTLTFPPTRNTRPRLHRAK